MIEQATLGIAIDDLRNGWTRSHLWLELAHDDMRLRYRRSVLGPLWTTLGTGFFILILSVLWIEIMGKQASEFVPWVTIGLTVWQLVTAIVVEGATTFTLSASIIQNIPMPLSVHVYRIVMRHLLNFSHNFLVVIIVLSIFPQPLNSSLLLVIPGALIIVITAIACSVVLGVLGARYRDFSYAIGTLMGPMFFLTPIIWSPDAISGSRARLVDANPFAHFIALIREPLLGNQPSLMNYGMSIGSMLLLGIIALHLLGKHRERVPYWIG